MSHHPKPTAGEGLSPRCASAQVRVLAVLCACDAHMLTEGVEPRLEELLGFLAKRGVHPVAARNAVALAWGDELLERASLRLTGQGRILVHGRAAA
jgi:hypothetical protein